MALAHLHRDDAPAALAILAAVLEDRRDLVSAWEPTDVGAYVDFDELTAGPLSSTEIATVRIAWGVATLERHGGPPPAAARHLLAAFRSARPHASQAEADRADSFPDMGIGL